MTQTEDRQMAGKARTQPGSAADNAPLRLIHPTGVLLMSDHKVLMRLWRYLVPERWYMAGSLLAMALVALTETAVPALMKPVIDHGAKHGFMESLWMAPTALVLLAVLRSVAQFATSYLPSRISHNVLVTLRSQMFAAMLRAGMPFYARQPSASLINAVVFEVQQVLSLLSSVIVTLVRDSLTVIGLLSYLLWLNWQLTLIIAVIAPIIGWIMRRVNQRLRLLNRQQQTLFNELSYVVEESAAGHKVIKLHDGFDYELRRFVAAAQQLRGFGMRIAVAGGVSQPLTQLLATLAIAVVLVVAISQAGAHQTTVGGFAAYVTAMMLVISPLKHLTDVNQSMQRGLVAAEWIFGLMDEPSESTLLGQSPANQSNFAPLQRAQGELRLERVSYRYPAAAASSAAVLVPSLKAAPMPKPAPIATATSEQDSNPAALQEVDLHIRRGEVVALVGPSGSGKTTLVNLLPRFLVPTEGRILLDGEPIERYRLQDLRRQFALVSQEVILFNDTLAANIAYGEIESVKLSERNSESAATQQQRQARQERLHRAVRAAHLEEVVAQLPQGLETNIGDNGARLSGGQRQRVAIARAIYKDAPILILDEATSALDNESERHVREALEELMRDRTTLIIAHRLSTVENAHRIVVLDHGRVLEQGRHTELLQAGGMYAHLYRLMGSDSST